MIRVKQAVIVEGKYDKIKLQSVLDALIIETDGFSIFKNKAKMSLLRRLADTRGLIVMTDSDGAGFKIRNYLNGCIPKDKIIHVYIPDIAGKEKRKAKYSKEGKLGVEGMSKEVLLSALDRAGVTSESGDDVCERKEITRADLYEDGITGGKDSSKRRCRLLAALDLPEHMSTTALLEVLNTFLGYEDYKNAVKNLNN